MTTRRSKNRPAIDARRRGYVLMEMIVTLGLIALLAGIAGRLMAGALTTMREIAAADRTSAAVDFAVRNLRRDVERATNVANSANGLALDGIVWRMDGDALVRSTDGRDTRYESLPGGVTLGATDGRVTLGIGRAVWTLRPIVEGDAR